MTNRSFKFRIWDKKEKKFVLDYKTTGWDGVTELYVTIDGKIGEFWGCYDSWSFGESEEVVNINKIKEERFLIQQSTGVFDKNRKEIYEGDIIKIYDFNGLIFKDNLEVFYNDGAFWIKNEKQEYKHHLGGWSCKLEIIGNICET
jgi:uncharacterized phage protein (TIGR01671 family)